MAHLILVDQGFILSCSILVDGLLGGTLVKTDWKLYVVCNEPFLVGHVVVSKTKLSGGRFALLMRSADCEAERLLVAMGEIKPCFCVIYGDDPRPRAAGEGKVGSNRPWMCDRFSLCHLLPCGQ